MTELPSTATMWFILGVILLIVEAMHTGVLAVFFALGAWVTAVLMWLGVVESSWAELAAFLIVSVASLLLLRNEMRKWLTGLRHPAGEDAALDDFTGHLATVIEAIEPGKNNGKVEFRGSHWAARSERLIAKGTVVKIVARDNLTLSVQPNEEAQTS